MQGPTKKQRQQQKQQAQALSLQGSLAAELQAAVDALVQRGVLPQVGLLFERLILCLLCVILLQDK